MTKKPLAVIISFIKRVFCVTQDDGILSLLTDDWGAIEEVLLLDAVEQEGLGNWFVGGLQRCFER